MQFLCNAGADAGRPLAHAGKIVLEEVGGRAFHDIADMQRLSRLHGEGAEQIGAREIAQNKCFAQLEGSIVEALKAPDASSYFKANACAVLRAKGVVK